MWYDNFGSVALTWDLVRRNMLLRIFVRNAIDNRQIPVGWQTSIRKVLICLLCVLGGSRPSDAQRGFGHTRMPLVDGKRVALVVGNNKYPKGALRNAVNDAQAIVDALRDLHFSVDVELDAGRATLDRAINHFISKLDSGDVALFYYAGHGVQIEGENYLIPVDFAAEDIVDVKYQAYPASEVEDKMDQTGASLKIMILDACRNNPFHVSRSRSLSRGLAQMAGGRGSFIAFATAAGQVADDNPNGGHGLFTEHLLEILRQPGLTLDEVFNHVREAVDQDSGGLQLPYVYSGVIGDFYFRPPAQPPEGLQTEVDERPSAALKGGEAGVRIQATPARHQRASLLSTRWTGVTAGFTFRFEFGLSGSVICFYGTAIATDDPDEEFPGRDMGKYAIKNDVVKVSTSNPGFAFEGTLLNDGVLNGTAMINGSAVPLKLEKE